MTRKVNGVVVGLVAEMEDPEGLGRIRVTFPMFDSQSQSSWARIATPFASNAAGLFFQPELGDEVLVSFIDGDIRRPYIVGFLYSGENVPPEEDAAKRTIKTISGHLMVFDDTEGEESITIEDKNGNKVVMNADGIEVSTDKTLTLKGNEVNVEATSQLTLKGNPVHINP